MTLLFSTTETMAQEYKKVDEPKGLEIGTIAPSFSGKDKNGNIVDSNAELKKGPVVLIFYRGQWCPVCNRYLSNLQDSLQPIIDKGAQVIAVSPEKPEYLGKTLVKTGAEFTLLYDEDYKISKSYDVLFRPENSTLTIYNTLLGANLKNAQSDDSQQLPIPATFIIAQDGKIVWRQFNPDYKKRASVAEILNNIP